MTANRPHAPERNAWPESEPRNALLSPAVTKRVISRFARIPRRAPPLELRELTTREQEVFRLIAQGLSNAEIGRELYISEGTVKTHVTHVLQKLNLRDRVQAVVLAYQTGLLEPDAQPNMHDAKSRLSELVAAAERGEEVVIARNGAPAARLIAITPDYTPVRLGILAGEIELGPDFDAPLPDFAAYAE